MVNCSRRPSTGCFVPTSLELAAEAVDDDEAIAIGAHQILVEGLLDARLSDDGARLYALVFRSRQLRFGDFADVAEQMRGERRRRISARRHFLVG